MARVEGGGRVTGTIVDYAPVSGGKKDGKSKKQGLFSSLIPEVKLPKVDIPVVSLPIIGKVDLGEALDDIGNDAGKIIRDGARHLDKFTKPVQDAIAPVADAVGEVIRPVVDVIEEAAKPVADAIKPVKDMVGDVVGSLPDAIANAVDLAVGTAKKTADVIADVGTKVEDLASNAVDTIGSALEQVPWLPDPETETGVSVAELEEEYTYEDVPEEEPAESTQANSVMLYVIIGSVVLIGGAIAYGFLRQSRRGY